MTFLFTDIEGSTGLLRELGDAYPATLERHRALLDAAISAHGGHRFGTEGDAVFAVFDGPAAALAAAAEAQRALTAEPWGDGTEIRVRMGIHTGEATLAGDDYVGLALHQTARIAATAHGGQVVISEATRQLVADSLPGGVTLTDLGSHRLKDLPHPERIHQLVIDGLPDTFPPLRSLGGRAVNLPPQLTSFIGRAELAEVKRLLDGTRLLTLSGPGGTGKTRLSVELAHTVAPDFADGAQFVALDSVSEPDAVPTAIVAALGLTDSPGAPPIERLTGFLRERQLLLVLDNLEQVIEAAPSIAQLLRDAPRIKVIATSRVPLRVAGEQEFAVPPLGLPQVGGPPRAADAIASEAVRLFVDRAMAVQPAFALTDENAGDVIEIVSRLDGLPLAIELAAARTRILPVAALRARLDQRLGVLVGGSRDRPARQQTIRGAIDWSYDLLSSDQRQLFSRFSVFAGGSWLTQAETVCGPVNGHDVFDGLATLVEQSLLRSVPIEADEPRFSMLAVIREYGLEKLAESGEVDELQRRHALAYLGLLETCAPGLLGGKSRQLLDRLEPDHDNLRAVLSWAVRNGEVEVALRFVGAIWRYWQIRGHLHEAQERIEEVLAMPNLASAGDALLARAFAAAGGIAYWRGEYERMEEHYAAGLRHARASGDAALTAEALYNVGFRWIRSATFGLAKESEEVREATKGWMEALELYRSIDDREGIANATWGLALSSWYAQEWDEARRRFQEALELYRQLDNRFGLGWALYMDGTISFMTADDVDALERVREALGIFVGTGDKTGIALSIGIVGLLAQRAGDRQRAWRLYGAVEGLQRSAGVALAQGPNQPPETRVPDTAPTDDALAEAAWEEGLRLSIDEAVDDALRD